VTLAAVALAKGMALRNSTAPTSVIPCARGKPLPRWSKLSPAVLLPLLIAGLADIGKWVSVGPPLLVSGPSTASRGTALVPVWLPLPVKLKLPTPATPTRLLSPDTLDVKSNDRSGEFVLTFPLTIVLDSETVPVPPIRAMPPPLTPAELFVSVLFWN